MSSNSTWDVNSPQGAPQRPASVYPLDWLARTFTSPTRTGELLRPELENGTITPADYRLAQAFLPGTFPLMKATFGIIGATIVGAFGYARKPRWNQTKMALGTGFGTFTGYMYGTYKQANAHYQFQNTLQRPEGLEQAMENVNKRLGGTKPLNISFHFARKEDLTTRPRPGHETSSLETPDGWATASEDTPTSQKIPSRQPAPALTNAPPVPGRWVEIRKANSNSAQNSSWDQLRQTHERARMSTDPESDHTAEHSGRMTQDTPYNPSSDNDNDRARQQAEFDAMLEAERRLGQQGDARFDSAPSL